MKERMIEERKNEASKQAYKQASKQVINQASRIIVDAKEKRKKERKKVR